MQKNDYIVIFATIPNKKNEKDGMIQRELAIDSLLSNYNRVYIEQSKLNLFKQPRKWIKRFITMKKNKLDCFKNDKVKLFCYLSDKKLYNLLKNAKKIYCHSLYKLTSIPSKYIDEFADKIIVDIHGCVIEEEIFYNIPQNVIDYHQSIEKNFYPKINTLISVSENMEIFYKNKYPNMDAKFINLPIFNRFQINDNIINSKKNINIIYSGGAQKWQNVDIMVDSINKIANNYKITLLTPDINVFSEKLKKYKNLLKKIEIKTVPSNFLYKEYEKADFGYILRDDIIVNKVACPTKIIEYLSYGIIPIVLQPEIGDFDKLGYSYILNSDLLMGNIPSEEDLYKMRLNNFKVLEKLFKIREKGQRELIEIIESP